MVGTYEDYLSNKISTLIRTIRLLPQTDCIFTPLQITFGQNQITKTFNYVYSSIIGTTITKILAFCYHGNKCSK